MSLNPARRFGLPGGRLSPGAPADLVLFDPDAPFRLDRFTLRSKSKNTPFDGALLQGRVSGTWVGGDGSSTRRRSPHDPRDHLGGRGAPGRSRLPPICWAPVPFGIVMTRLFGLGDLRQIGSGNIGATNVLRTGNKTAAALTLILDAGKGGIAVLIARALVGEDAAQVAGLAAFSATAFRCSLASRAARAWRPSSARFWRCSGRRGSRRA
jgi:hypothetical protein